MKKSISTILIAYLLFISLFDATGQKTIHKDLLFKGNVKTIKENVYSSKSVNDNPEKGSLKLSYLNNFNEYGNKISDIKYNSSGEIDNQYKYFHNSKNQRIRMDMLSAEGALIRWIEYRYNEEDLIFEDQSYAADGTPEKLFVYVYDSLDRVVEDFTYLSDGAMNMRFTYIYNESGQLIGNDRFSPEGVLLRSLQYSYDKSGYPSQEVHLSADGKIQRTMHFTYKWDQQGNWVQKFIFENDLPTQIVEREIVYR
jgi:hypothetical protein